MSELAGPWLNLPILVAGTSDLVKEVKACQDGKRYENYSKPFELNLASNYFKVISLHHRKVQELVEKAFTISSLVAKMQWMII